MGADPSDMSVAELKRALEMRGIDFRDAIEKEELMERLRQDMNDEEHMSDSLRNMRVDDGLALAAAACYPCETRPGAEGSRRP